MGRDCLKMWQRERERRTDGPTDRRTDRQTDRQTERERGRERNSETDKERISRYSARERDTESEGNRHSAGEGQSKTATPRETERQTDRQTQTQTQKKTEREREGDRERERDRESVRVRERERTRPCTDPNQMGRRPAVRRKPRIIRAPATRAFPCRRPSVGNRRLYTLAAPAADPEGRRGYPRSTPARIRSTDVYVSTRFFAQDVQKHRFLQCFVAFGGVHDFRLTGRPWRRLRVPRGQA